MGYPISWCRSPVAVPGVRLVDDATALHTDRGHSLGSLPLPLAALPSLPKLELRSRLRSLAPKISRPQWGRDIFGAGGRTRTGTLSPAVDFGSTTSTIPSHRQVCLMNHQPCWRIVYCGRYVCHSITPAERLLSIIHFRQKCKHNFWS